jgi:hypothetical protein
MEGVGHISQLHLPLYDWSMESAQGVGLVGVGSECSYGIYQFFLVSM